MRLSVRSPLAFPSSVRPGFDQGHVAGKSVLFSALPSGSTFTNLLNGKLGTTAGAPTAVMTAAGPGVSYPLTTAQTGISTGIVPIPSSTMALILIPAAGVSNANMIRTASAGGIMSLALGGTTYVPSVFNGATSSNLSGVMPPLTIGVPYFLAASVNTAASGNSPTCVVLTNLLTGQMWSVTVQAAARPLSPTNGVPLIGQGGNQILAAMTSVSALDLPELQAWAQDPWSFWYPRANDNVLGIPRVPHASGVTVAITGAAAITIAGIVGKLETIAITGAAATTAPGALTVSSTKALSGAAATTAAGALAEAISLALIGASVSAAAGTVSVQTGSSVNINISGAAVGAGAGSPAKTISILIAGAVITTAAGAVGFSIPISVTISGAGVAVTAGQVSIGRTAYVDNIPPGMTLSLRRKRPLRNP